MRVLTLNPLLGPSLPFERGWQTAKLNKLSCLLPSPSPVEVVETQKVSAQSVSVSADSASIFCQAIAAQEIQISM